MEPSENQPIELVQAESTDLMAVDATKVATFNPNEAGLGSDLVDAADIILPRVVVLQALSKPVVQKLPGASEGVLWLSPHNRPVTLAPDQIAKFVVITIYPAQRLWTPIDEGGGLVCEMADGSFIAREAQGLTGARLIVNIHEKGPNKGQVKEVDWEGGRPTNSCRECAYGLAAEAHAAGRAVDSKGRATGWLPKMVQVIVDNAPVMVRLPDKMRAPKCTGSKDVLALVQVAPFGDMPGSIELAFLSFARTAEPTGRQLAGMIKTAFGEPAWGRIYGIRSRHVQSGDYSYHVPVIAQLGYAGEAMRARGRQMFDMSQQQNMRPDVSDGGDHYEAPVPDGGTPGAPPEGAPEGPAPGDAF